MCFFLQRYYYYIEKGIKRSMLAPQHPDVMKNVQMLIPERLCTSVELKWLNDELLEEVNNDYELSLRKAIGKAKTRKIFP